MFYIIETGGKQYLVSPEEKIKIEKLEGKAGEEVVFDKVLAIIDKNEVKIGRPYLSGVSVSALIENQARAKKVIVFRYHSKTRYRKKKGHRQNFTEVKIK
ncbi:MAG: 50S ribosomal protein L21 [Candidatus Pacebacteria bacterium]|nr:50S ribosomal protein L21 [Candidatus Paceibacterota bacterium]